MRLIRTIEYNLSKIFAITEKNIRLNLRFKYNVIFEFITPIFSVILPLIIMGTLFNFNEQYGPWTANNYFIYQFLAYNIILLKGLINEFPSQFRLEKFWQTLPGLIIAPFNRFNLLLGIFLSSVILKAIPLVFFILLSYIFYPISIFTLMFVILLFLLIALIFSGLGLILGVFAISNENIWRSLKFTINIFFLFSCITFPFYLFPEFIQNIINLNPLFYMFDIIRIAWIDNSIIQTISGYIFNFLILIIGSIALPSIGVVIFNKVYKKYGIVGS